MKKIILTAISIFSLNATATSLVQEYQNTEGCSVQIECENNYCQAVVEDSEKSLKLEGQLKVTDSKIEIYRKYDGVETRWFHDDEYTGFNELTIKKQSDDTYKIYALAAKYNFFPHFPKSERVTISCKKLTKLN